MPASPWTSSAALRPSRAASIMRPSRARSSSRPTSKTRKSMERLRAVDQDDVRGRGAAADRLDRLVLVGGPPRARGLAIRELHEDDPLRVPLALEHLVVAAADEEAATGGGHRVGVAAAVLLERVRVPRVADVADHIDGHTPDVNQRGPGDVAGPSEHCGAEAPYIMPPMPPMSGMPPPPLPSLSGASATIASVVRMFLAIDAAFCSAERVTIAGSMTPAWTRSTISPVAAFRPSPAGDLRTSLTTTEPSKPAFSAIWRSGSSSARTTIFAPVFS